MSMTPPTSILLTGNTQTQVNFLLGPWIIGCVFDLILQGALVSQFVNYVTWYRDDKGGLKVVVAGLCLLTILKSVQVFVIIWNHSIIYFDDLQGAVLLNFTTWWDAGNLLMVAIIGLYLQAYFLFRHHVVSRSPYVVMPLADIFLLHSQPWWLE
ncbi:hypothetical protein B0H19DRAFT_92268 [Mycena capillaripes]|nr:hypothetical protein B0H19DRAFT_92268 [Mycena capillaripes]